MKNALGLIPARGGSKGVPRKNIAPLLGRPLLSYTCDAALASTRLSRVVLSTDDDEIAVIGRDCGVEVPFIRPSELAQDNTSSLAVAQHAVRWLEDHESFSSEVVVLLQPTSPLRRSLHIDEVIELMERTNADTVVSVIEVPHCFNPFTVMSFQDGSLRDFMEGPVQFDRFRRQDMPTLYARNGPVLLATRTQTLLEANTFYGELVVPYIMDPEESIDIDSAFDLELAAWMLQRRAMVVSV